MSMKQRYDELEQAIGEVRRLIASGAELYICCAIGTTHQQGTTTLQARNDLRRIINYGLNGYVSLEAWLHWDRGIIVDDARAIRLEWLDAIHEQLIAERKERV